MNRPSEETEDPKLRALLRASLPAPALPPGFPAAVWRRIEREEAGPAGRSWIDALANWLLAPRRALAAAAAIVMLGAIAGSWQGSQQAHQAERDRYLAAVSPSTTR